jgi:putative nucleotidyltransferase with HDIG domain
VVRAWGTSIESRDTYTFGHSERVAQHAVALARLLGLEDQEQTTVLLGAYLHDIGMVRVPHEIIRKPGPLTNDELLTMRMHTSWGLELVACVDFPWDIKSIIRWHHERYDGTGYPDRLKGDEIPVAAQIVGIFDVYDAMLTARPYQEALSKEEALERMQLFREWWSPAVFGGFMEIVSATPGPSFQG